MTSPYRIKRVVLASGERFPVLLDRDGLPMFEPSVFALTELRGRNLSTNTISSVLRAVMAFHLILEGRAIDLDARLAKGHLLALSEVEDLARLCRLPLAELAHLSEVVYSPAPSLTALERARVSATAALPAEVDPGVVATRLQYILTYIQWLVNERLSRDGLDPEIATRLSVAVKLVSEAIDSRIPRRLGRNLLNQREGLSEEDVAELLRVTDPQSPDNPWRDQHTRYRNALLIRWFLYLGPRVGELLGIRVSDIVIYRKEVTIHRRADDPDDPRPNQPETKTRPRVLPLSDRLLAETQGYILNHRRLLPEAKNHPFLFVASRTGRPMSLTAVAKLFKELRERCPSLPRKLSAHLLRHTWNDAFSARMDAAGVSPEDERQARSYLMGWSPTSGTAAIYTRRHVRNKARAASLELQHRLVNRKHG